MTSLKAFILFLAAVLCMLQEGFTQSEWKAGYYELYTVETYQSFPPLNEQININAFDFPLLHAAIFYKTNERRIKLNRVPVKYAKELEIAAWNHSKAMVEKNFFSHQDNLEEKRRTPADRAILAGISNPFLAENIATAFVLNYEPKKKVFTPGRGKFSYSPGGELIQPHTYLSLADALVEEWMNSKPHRENILSKDALQLGCGVFLFINSAFNDMPEIKATQNYQLYEPLKVFESEDPFPPGYHH